MMPSRALIAGVLAMLLGGCVTPPAPDSPDTPGRSWKQREDALRLVRTWEMRGRIAIDTGSEARQARFTWWQDGESLRLNVRGPLNAGAVEIRGDSETLTLRHRRETRTLTDPEYQLSELLGWWLPVTSLPNWLLGLPDERYPIAEITLDAARVSTLEQRAWSVRYTDYENRGSADIPGSIMLSHAPLELVVTIDTWGPRTDPP
jgi:outer membrane lipoprotein LolB